GLGSKKSGMVLSIDPLDADELLLRESLLSKDTQDHVCFSVKVAFNIIREPRRQFFFQVSIGASRGWINAKVVAERNWIEQGQTSCGTYIEVMAWPIGALKGF